jgi:hypothetical protein
MEGFILDNYATRCVNPELNYTAYTRVRVRAIMHAA